MTIKNVTLKNILSPTIKYVNVSKRFTGSGKETGRLLTNFAKRGGEEWNKWPPILPKTPKINNANSTYKNSNTDKLKENSVPNIKSFRKFNEPTNRLPRVNNNTEVRLLPSSNYNDIPIRKFSTHGGKFSPNSPIVKNPVTDNGMSIQGDISGGHFTVVVTACTQTNCNITNCANANNGSVNPCGKTASYHQGPINKSYDSQLIYEFALTMTHSIPIHMNGNIIDSTHDVNGPHPKGQSVAAEKAVSTLSKTDVTNFKENSNVTTYLQKDSRSTSCLDNMPLDSILK